MPSTNIFTRRRMGFDYKVWVTMICVVLASAALVGYNYKLKAKDAPCESLPVYANGLKVIDEVTFTAGVPINFRSYFTRGDEVIWNFGDNSGTVAAFSPRHVYQKEGIFRVTVTLNGKCEYERRIVVKMDAPVKRDTLGNVIEEIVGPDKGFMRTKITFSTPLPAEHHQWYVENDANYTPQSGDSVNFTFRTPGSFIIVLVLNGNIEKKIRKMIVISRSTAQEDGLIKPKVLIEDVIKDMKQKPPEVEVAPVDENKPPVDVKPPVPKKYKSAANEILKTYIQAVVCGEKTSAEFEEYLCDGANTVIIENNRDRKQFKSFCEEIKGKKIEILSVEATRDNTLCATKLSVRLDRRGRLARSPCKD